MAVSLGALSADHLEASTETDIKILANSDTVAVALPGASIGLGEPFAPTRKLLDAGACVAIASDYNPGSAPMGDLLTQASILATYQKMTTAEVFAGLTFRAAKALDLKNIGKIADGFQADFQAYPCSDYREILYHQGQLKPFSVWKKGERI
jgi:imidazolonepropionase